MAWKDDKYIRDLLDGREKWGTVLSLTAVAASLLFLVEHPHRSWLNMGPMAIGFFGSLYVFVVNCYYEQAEAFANAESKLNETHKQEAIRADRWINYALRIGFLGWINLLSPLLIGAFATLALYFGFEATDPTP